MQGEFTPFHLTSLKKEHLIANNGIGPYFLVPGSEGRAKEISQYLKDVKVYENPRYLNTYIGTLTREINGKKHDIVIGANSTGMGCPSVEIVLTELIHLGAKRFIRVGSAGSMQNDHIKVGAIAIASGAVRDDHTADTYVTRDYPAVAHPDVVLALKKASIKLKTADKTFCGIVQSKSSLFAREFFMSPKAKENEQYIKELEEMKCVASEMEAAQLFVMSSYYSKRVYSVAEELDAKDVIKSGCVLAIIGDCTYIAPKDVAHKIEDLAINTALEAMVELYAMDMGLSKPY